MAPASRMLVIAGNIATGKTHLVSKIGEALELPTFPECWEENPWFNTDQPEIFLAQLWFLLAAGADHAEMSIRGGVQERSIHEHAHVFAREYLAGDDAHLLAEIYSRLDTALPDPDLLIYLKAPVPELLKRAHVRGRAQEKALTEEHLEKLETRYDELVAGWSRSPVIEVDTQAIDVRSPKGARHILDRVTEALQ